MDDQVKLNSKILFKQLNNLVKQKFTSSIEGSNTNSHFYFVTSHIHL